MASFVFGPPPRAWGRSQAWPTASLPPSVHPHVRGDDRPFLRPAYDENGPPPRAWGRFPAHDRREPPARSTPTCVGTMSRWRRSRLTCAVHPHVRGDDTNESRVAVGSRFENGVQVSCKQYLNCVPEQREDSPALSFFCKHQRPFLPARRKRASGRRGVVPRLLRRKLHRAAAILVVPAAAAPAEGIARRRPDNRLIPPRQLGRVMGA